MRAAARLGDKHLCPMANSDGSAHVGGPISAACGSVLIGFMPAARVGDTLVCRGAVDTIASGEGSCLIGYMPAARLGDPTSHGGLIEQGFPTVLIGR